MIKTLDLNKKNFVVVLDEDESKKINFNDFNEWINSLINLGIIDNECYINKILLKIDNDFYENTKENKFYQIELLLNDGYVNIQQINIYWE